MTSSFYLYGLEFRNRGYPPESKEEGCTMVASIENGSHALNMLVLSPSSKENGSHKMFILCVKTGVWECLHLNLIRPFNFNTYRCVSSPSDGTVFYLCFCPILLSNRIFRFRLGSTVFEELRVASKFRPSLRKNYLVLMRANKIIIHGGESQDSYKNTI